MATGTFPTGISRVYPTSDNTRIVRFIFSVFEDTPFHPRCPFAIASMAILAFGWFEIYRVDRGLLVRRDLLVNLARTFELFLDGSMQPPLIATSNELRTA